MPDWTNTLDRYLKGVSYKGIIKEVQDKILKDQEGTLKVFEESEDEGDDKKDFFFLNAIK